MGTELAFSLFDEAIDYLAKNRLDVLEVELPKIFGPKTSLNGLEAAMQRVIDAYLSELHARGGIQ